MIVKVESLDIMFEQSTSSKPLSFEGTCHNCGYDVVVELTKTSGGYGLLGGVLYEPDPDHIILVCDRCHEKQACPIAELDHSI